MTAAGPVVFTGDSITDCRRRDDALGLGGGYVDIIAETLRGRRGGTAVVNTGVSGDRVEHLVDRWHADALAHQPSVLSVLIGVNDTMVAFYQGRPTPPEVFRQRYTDLLDRAVRAGVPRLVVLEPFFVGTDDAAVRWCEGNEFFAADLAARRSAIRELAGRYGATFVPLHEAFTEAATRRGRAVVAPDGVHPSALGHRLIARSWLAAHDAA